MKKLKLINLLLKPKTVWLLLNEMIELVSRIEAYRRYKDKCKDYSKPLQKPYQDRFDKLKKEKDLQFKQVIATRNKLYK